ncbi:hypothetical protein JCM11641_006960 [Rhodosporidiobolus odoratus]
MTDSDGFSSGSDAEGQPSTQSASTSTGLPQAKRQRGNKGTGRDKGGAGGGAADDGGKRRSSKACDNCRKSKCKCTRNFDASGGPVGACQNCLAVGSECTFLGASRKRGPPKGYIEAIESRLHRMEALLGGLLGSDDPRAQTLLGELIGDTETRDVLARDLKAASDSTKPPKRSWKKEFVASQEELGRLQQQQQMLPPVVATGFDATSTTATVGAAAFQGQQQPAWLTDDDLSSLGGVATTGSALGFDPSSYGGVLESPTSTAASPSFGLPALSTSGPSLAADLSLSASPRQRRRLDLPSAHSASPIASLPLPLPSILAGGSVSGVVAAGSPNAGFPTSFGPSTSFTAPSPLVGSAPSERKQMAYAFTLPAPGSLPSNRQRIIQGSTGMAISERAIGHTGLAHFEGLDGEGEEGKREMTELADVVGQLSLNENAEVRYHGRSSSLYLITRSTRFRDFFWQFPSAGVWPPADFRVIKTEREILSLAPNDDPLPSMTVQSQLLTAYWTYIHPHYPVLEKITFMRAYRNYLAHRDSADTAGKVPMVLLFSMFALAARYCDLDEARKDGKYWTAGQEYLEKARKIINHDYGSSKLVTVQALLLIAYREIGVGAMSSAWMNAGMAIRMAQDLGLFRDVEKWHLPTPRFTPEEIATRKRVWWACVILDRYTSSYIGRPGTIHERDYDTTFPSEDEPDEHEQWRPTRLDGTEWSSPTKTSSDFPPEDIARVLKSYPPCKANTMSCFNAAGALSVIINRIISNIYAIRIRVLGQSSETLLSLLDQSLASWFLALPPHLQYNPTGTKVPPPHILSLHLQFYSSLILLHRPFIPGQNSTASLGNFPSHAICTTASNAIANIITTWRKTFTLRQCPPFLTYPIFSAAIICVYNASFDEALARPAKLHLVECMNALKEMELIWGSAIRAWDLLHGLVDLRDAELHAELAGLDDEVLRGIKRPAMDVGEPSASSFADVCPTNFHNRPLGGTARRSSKSATRRRGSSSGTNPLPSSTVRTSFGSPGSPVVPMHGQLFPPASAAAPLPRSPQFSFTAPSAAPVMPSQAPKPATFATAAGPPPAAQTFDILKPAVDLSQVKAPPGADGGMTNFSDLLDSFLPPIEAAGSSATAMPLGIPAFAGPSSTDQSLSVPPSNMGVPNPLIASFDPTSAFFGMPLGADMTDDWFNYSYNAFATAGSEQGGTPESSGAAGSATKSR